MKRDGLTIVIYGQPKTGKTRLAATFPKPILIIGTDKYGTDSIQNVDGVDFVLITKSSEVELYTQIAIKRKYATLVVDNCTQLQQIVLSEMLGYETVPIQQERGVMKKVDNQLYSFNTKTALDHVFKFSGHRVFLAHERDQTSKDENAPAPTDDAIKPYITCSISRGVAEWLNGTCSHICQTFIREKKEMISLPDMEPLYQGTGLGEYCLRTGPHTTYKAGLRVPVGVNPPNIILKASYDKMIQIIAGKYKLEDGES